MALVLDASITLSWFFPDERTAFTDTALEIAAQEECWAPAVWRLEFSNALLVAERKRRLSRDERLQVLDEASRLNLRCDTALQDFRRISAMADRHALSTYDAAYLELALRLGSSLITLDKKLATAATEAGVTVHAPGRTGASQLRGRYNV
ncbi:MAG TPA: type II toxin-antitoxin system VapC family toxin [Burkholderiales bacterium]|nr:type II toxin-antitoxin system VapC family toxin [Burkholderiales bacterium]